MGTLAREVLYTLAMTLTALSALAALPTPSLAEQVFARLPGARSVVVCEGGKISSKAGHIGNPRRSGSRRSGCVVDLTKVIRQEAERGEWLLEHAGRTEHGEPRVVMDDCLVVFIRPSASSTSVIAATFPLNHEMSRALSSLVDVLAAPMPSARIERRHMRLV